MKFSICDKCKAFNHLTILRKLNEVYPDASYEIGCNNMCGIGRSKVVVIFNNKAIIANTEDEVIYKIKQVNNDANLK